MNQTEILLAITSTFIAFAALLLSVWSGWETRRYNRLSVYPYLNFWVKSTWDDKYAGICVRNNGAGPAVIKEVRVYIDNMWVQINNKGLPASQIEIWNYVVERLNLNPRWTYIEYINPKAAIRPEQEIWFVAADTEKIPDNKKGTFLESLSRLSIKIEYESIYCQTSNIGINIKDYITPWDISNLKETRTTKKKGKNYN